MIHFSFVAIFGSLAKFYCFNGMFLFLNTILLSSNFLNSDLYITLLLKDQVVVPTASSGNAMCDGYGYAKLYSIYSTEDVNLYRCPAFLSSFKRRTNSTRSVLAASQQASARHLQPVNGVREFVGS